MINFKLEIQESERLVAKGIVCIIRSDGKKIYCRLAKDGKEISLVPLTKDEMVKAEIQESDQTANSEFWNIEVQESEQKTPAQIAQDEAYERAKKAQKIPLNSVEDAEKMREIAERAKEILERKGVSPEDLKAENEDLRAKLELIASRELERRMEMWKIDPETRKAIRENPERLKGYELAKQENMPDFGSIPEGSAPLNSAQIYGQIKEQSFNSEKEMIDYLRKNKTPENEAILRKLFEKTVQGIVEKRSWEIPFENANPKSKSESDSNVKAVEINILTPKDPNQESEVEKWTKKKRRIE